MSKLLSSFTALGKQFHIPGQYEFVKELGAGAYGSVVAVKDRITGETLAVKRISSINLKSILMKRCLREIKLLRHFAGHENIVHLRDLEIVFKSDGTFDEVYLFEEAMERDLHAVIRSDQVLTEAHISHIMHQLFSGLHYIHSANVIHRDLKPGNLLVNEHWNLRICDFGLARGSKPRSRAMSASDHERGMTEYVATRWYRAPEILMRSHNYLEPSDIWSAGCIFAELLTRKPIFKGRSSSDQIRLIIGVLGTPTEEALEHIASSGSKKYIHSLPITPPQNWNATFPSTTRLCLDLLSKLICWDFTQRITAREALTHPHFGPFFDRSASKSCDLIFDDRFEQIDDMDGMRKLIIAEFTDFQTQKIRRRHKRRLHGGSQSRPGSAASSTKSHQDVAVKAENYHLRVANVHSQPSSSGLVKSKVRNRPLPKPEIQKLRL